MLKTARCSELYRKFGATIYSRCRRLLGDEARAERATEESFFLALPQLDAARDDVAALKCVYRVTDAVCAALP